MADNVSVTPGSGATIASDDVGGVQFQKVKIDVGADGASAMLGEANPLPVSLVSGAGVTSLATLDDIVAVEDAAAGSGYSGVPLLAVRQDSHSDLAADGDFISPTIDADGGLRVSIVAGAGSGGTAIADDAAFTVGTTSLTPVGGVYKSSVDSVNDGDAGAFAMTATRAIHVQIVGDDVGSAVADEDGSVAVGATNVAQTISANYEYDGSALVRVRGDHTVAHDAADAGNPPKIGAVAEASVSGVTNVADGDRTNLYAGLDGVLFVRPHCNLEDIVSGYNTNTDGASTELIAAQGAGIKTALVGVLVTNTHATTDGYVELKDGATTKFIIPAPHSSGFPFVFPVPLRGTANTAWNSDASAAIDTIKVSAIGFKTKL